MFRLSRFGLFSLPFAISLFLYFPLAEWSLYSIVSELPKYRKTMINQKETKQDCLYCCGDGERQGLRNKQLT